MAFFTSAITTLKTLVVAIGAGLGVWGVINLLEGYGNDNPCTCQQILDTKYQKIVRYTVRLYKPYATLDITPRNAGQVMPTV